MRTAGAAAVRLQAERGPDSIAVREADRSIAYADLEDRSNRLCSFLRALGVGGTSVVGLCVPRGIAHIVGALGIMKAGAAYLPLDPAHPAERLRFEIADCDVTIVVTSPEYRASAPRSVATVLLTNDGEPPGDALAAGAPPPVVGDDDLAYVIYTSGSTGRPKGVEITHRALSHLIAWHRDAFAIGANDVASHVAPVSFDASIWEVWPYLTAGATLCIASDAVARDPEALRAWMLEEKITIGFVSTPIAEQMIGLAWPPETALRTMLTGGDVLRRYPPPGLPFTLVNNYGPAECTVVATSGVVPPRAQAGAPAIGRPIANTQIVIVDENAEPVGAGDAGEICIGGPGVARGYRGLPDLTARMFVRARSGAAGGARLYRSGDRGRIVPGGHIEFLGRIDDQIKIRGRRIEPGEIERSLTDHPGVRDCAVVAHDVDLDDRRLIAYVVPATSGLPPEHDLRAFAATRLPEFMLPAHFVELPRLPLTSNGKIDRAELRERAVAPRAATGVLAPRTATEKRLAEILAALLHVDAIGVDENFFVLGGHSLLATQFIARIRDAFGARLSLRFVFASPTIAAIAAEVDRTGIVGGDTIPSIAKRA